MTVYTLGRKAFEAFWKDRAEKGERGALRIADGWSNTGRNIQDAWEAAAICVQQLVESMREPTTFERCVARTHREGQRPRQGGMVNVHTKPPVHYNAHPSGVECIEITRHMPFNLGNVIKYLWRAGLKENESEIKDLEKSLDYLNDEINKRKLALGLAPGYRWEPVPDARVKDHAPSYGPDGKGHQ